MFSRESNSGSRGRPGHWSGTLLAVLSVNAVAVIFAIVAVYAPPRSGEMAVVFAPGTTEVEAYGAIMAAGGRVVSSSRFDNIVIAYALDDGFRDRIGKFGGWFALAATGLCSAEAPANQLG